MNELRKLRWWLYFVANLLLLSIAAVLPIWLSVHYLMPYLTEYYYSDSLTDQYLGLVTFLGPILWYILFRAYIIPVIEPLIHRFVDLASPKE